MVRKLLSFFLLIWLSSSTSFGREVMRYRRFTTQDGLSHRIISMLAQDEEGYIWMGTWNGLCRFDGERFTTFNTTSDGSKLGRVAGVRFTLDGKLRVQNQNQDTFIFDPNTLTLSPCDASEKVCFVAKPTFYNAVDSAGLHFRRGEEEYLIPFKETSYTSNTHYTAILDRQGNLWANFDDALIQVSWSEMPFDHIERINGKGSVKYGDEVRATFCLSDSTLLCATKNHYIYNYSPNGDLLGYLSPEGKIVSEPTAFGSRIYDIAEDARGRIWMGSRGDGLYYFSKGDKSRMRMKRLSVDNGYLRNDNIYDLTISSYPNTEGTCDSLLWVGTWGGGVSLFKINKDVPELIGHATDSVKVRHFLMLPDSLMAVGTTSGLYLYDRHLNLHQKMGNIDVSAVLIASNNTIYLSSMGGGLHTLCRQQEEETYSLKPLTFDQANDVVLNMSQDGGGRIWFVSDNSLLNYNPYTQETQLLDQTTFGENITFSEAAPLNIGDSILWLGTTSGRFFVRTTQTDDFSPPLSIVGLENDIVTIGWGTSVDLRPIAFDYRVPRNIKYAWRELPDTVWHTIDDPEHFSISGIRPGEHHIEIRSTNAHGVWVNNVRSVYLHVVLTTWQWSIIAAIVLLCLVALALYGRVRYTASKAKEPKTINIVPSSPGINNADKAFIDEATRNIEDNINNTQYAVDDMAKALCMSRSILYQRFKEILDTTPAAFITEIRIKRAMQLLSQHKYSVTDVAFMTGFSDAKYFGKVFKKKVGVTPAKYDETELGNK